MEKYPITIETERLLIRPLTITDIIKWEPFFHNPASVKYFPNFITGNSENDARSWIQKQLDRYEDDRFGLHALTEKKTGEFIGQCGLLTQEIDNATEIEIGYSLLPEFEGKGYASEAAQFFKDFAFSNDITNSIISIIHKDNIPSQKVALRNDMTNSKATTFHGLDVYVFRVDK